MIDTMTYEEEIAEWREAYEASQKRAGREWEESYARGEICPRTGKRRDWDSQDD